MQASDGKLYLTDTVDTEVMLRLIKSIPSPNTEPFKLWLARVGYESLADRLNILGRLIFGTTLIGYLGYLGYDFARRRKSRRIESMNG
jgi:hypothetical protein